MSFTRALDETVADADAVYIAVDTPSRRDDGHADVSYVREAARETSRAAAGELGLSPEQQVARSCSSCCAARLPAAIIVVTSLIGVTL